MKKYFLAFLLGTSLVTLAACGGAGDEQNTAGDAPQEEGASAEAEQIFKQSCASCHGGNLEGGGAPKLAEVGNKYSKDEIEDIILNGQGGMPAGLIKGEDASIVASWLSEQK